MKKENSFCMFFKELWNIKNAKVVWQILIYVIILSTTFICIIKLYKKNEIVNTMKNMYFLDFTVSKEKEFILEVRTNPFFEINRDKELKEATLHLKDGRIFDVIVDTDRNMFMIESDISKNVGDKVYKYNATLKQQELKQEQEKSEEKNDNQVEDKKVENEKE